MKRLRRIVDDFPSPHRRVSESAQETGSASLLVAARRVTAKVCCEKGSPECLVQIACVSGLADQIHNVALGHSKLRRTTFCYFPGSCAPVDVCNEQTEVAIV